MRISLGYVLFCMVLIAGLLLTGPLRAKMPGDTEWKSLVQTPVAVDRTVEAGVPPVYATDVVDTLDGLNLPLSTYPTFLQVLPELMAEDEATADSYPERIREIDDLVRRNHLTEIIGTNPGLRRAQLIQDYLIQDGYPLSEKYPVEPEPIQPQFISDRFRDMILDRQDESGSNRRGPAGPRRRR